MTWQYIFTVRVNFRNYHTVWVRDWKTFVKMDCYEEIEYLLLPPFFSFRLHFFKLTLGVQLIFLYKYAFMTAWINSFIVHYNLLCVSVAMKLCTIRIDWFVCKRNSEYVTWNQYIVCIGSTNTLFKKNAASYVIV